MINDGFLVSGDPKGHGPSSVIVVGVNRGGTSAVAATLDALGLSLGASAAEPNFEDASFASALRQRDWARLRSLVTDREAKEPMFAWKHPDSRRHLWRIHRYFSNPRYIFVYRDIFAIANRKRLVHQRNILWSMATSLWDYAKILLFIQTVKPYALHVSYEKLLTNRDHFIDALATFCDRTVDPVQLSKVRERIAASPEAYVQWSDRSRRMLLLEHQGFKGLAEEITTKMIVGWAFRMGTAEPAVVEIHVNGTFVGSAIADQFTERLTNVAGDSRNGSIRFAFPCGSVSIQSGDRVDIRFEGTTISLVGCPATVA